MSCQVEPATSLFEEDWQRLGGDDGGLQSIAEFNAAFAKDNEGDDGGLAFGIEPHATSHPGSPVVSTFLEGTDLNFDSKFNLDVGDVEKSDRPTYPEFSDTAIFSTPYFDHSTRNPPSNPLFRSPALDSQWNRRSVSEPPDGGFQHLHRSPPAPPPSGGGVVLHRGGHFLGEPKHPHPEMQRLKSMTPRNRSVRSHHPYAPRAAPQTHRHQLRRANTTQPGHPRANLGTGPTSAPIPSAPPRHHMNVAGALPPPSMMNSTTRVCTPSGSPAAGVVSPNVMGTIDPQLGETPIVSGENRVLSIPLAVEDLRSMIIEAVRSALRGMEDEGKIQYRATEESRPGECMQQADKHSLQDG